MCSNMTLLQSQQCKKERSFFVSESLLRIEIGSKANDASLTSRNLVQEQVRQVKSSHHPCTSHTRRDKHMMINNLSFSGQATLVPSLAHATSEIKCQTYKRSPQIRMNTSRHDPHPTSLSEMEVHDARPKIQKAFDCIVLRASKMGLQL